MPAPLNPTADHRPRRPQFRLAALLAWGLVFCLSAAAAKWLVRTDRQVSTVVVVLAVVAAPVALVVVVGAWVELRAWLRRR